MESTTVSSTVSFAFIWICLFLSFAFVYGLQLLTGLSAINCLMVYFIVLTTVCLWSN